MTTMQRVAWPISLGAARITPIGGPKSLGMTESVTSDAQVVRQPRGLVKYQFDFPPLRGRAHADLSGMLLDLEDGANWTAAPCLYSSSPGYADLGMSPPSGSVPWSNGMTWSNGQGWQASRPLARTAAPAAMDAREVVIDISSWGGAIWRGFPVGFLHLGAYFIQRVIGIEGDLATVRIWPGLRWPVESNELVTLDPSLPCRLAPGRWSPGQREASHWSGASMQVFEVPYYTLVQHSD